MSVMNVRIAVLGIGLVVSVVAIGAARQQSGASTSVPSDPTAVGYLSLSKRHPDGSAGPAEFSFGYSAPVALQRLEQMQEFLTSFKRLTEVSRKTLTATELKNVGNTSREMQSLGFHNIPLVVEGTLRKQEYQIAQLEYQLALIKRDKGEASTEDVGRARAAYADATARFQRFWDTKRPTD
jgi:hypothetical protein